MRRSGESISMRNRSLRGMWRALWRRIPLCWIVGSVICGCMSFASAKEEAARLTAVNQDMVGGGQALTGGGTYSDRSAVNGPPNGYRSHAEHGRMPNADTPSAAETTGPGRPISSVETRLAVLEAAKSDVQVWAAVLIGVVLVLRAANVGLSVWQVGGMARKEVDDNLRDFDSKFSGVVNTSIGSVAQAIADYESRLQGLTRSVQQRETRIDGQIDELDKQIGELQSAAAKTLQMVRQDAEQLRSE